MTTPNLRTVIPAPALGGFLVLAEGAELAAGTVAEAPASPSASTATPIHLHRLRAPAARRMSGSYTAPSRAATSEMAFDRRGCRGAENVRAGVSHAGLSRYLRRAEAAEHLLRTE